MRIGIDMLALQSPGSRMRGVGRYGRNLLIQMIKRAPSWEFVLYAHESYPMDPLPTGSNARFEVLRPEPALGERALREAVARLGVENPDGIDLLLNLNPFEQCPYYDPVVGHSGPDGPRLATVVHDLIPFLFPDKYLADPLHAAWNYRRLRSLRHCDLLLTNSDATRSDCLRLLGLRTDRVVTIGGAGNAAFFTPKREVPPARKVRRILNGLGIQKPFVFSVSGIDDRKNLRGLLRAFAVLPGSLRNHYQLVVTCSMPSDIRDSIKDLAVELGISSSLVLTGEVEDESLRELYRQCTVFAFPSIYEGLGLPLLEAMLCGAAIVAGRNSSQIEVVGEAGRLANAEDPSEIASQIRELLIDPDLRRMLGERAVSRASGFRWEQAADRALAAIERVVQDHHRSHRRPAVKPRLAVVSPWAPKPSGISDYAIRLVDALRDRYTIDLIHDAGYVPSRSLGVGDLGCFDYRSLARRNRVLSYRGVLYQMGNSVYHEFLYESLLTRPGIVTLHDFNLAGFHYARAHRESDPQHVFAAEIAHSYPERSEALSREVASWAKEPGGVQGACVRRELYLNRRVLESAEAVVVHSPWCRDQVARLYPALVDKIHVIRMGARTRIVSTEDRRATRRRFGLPDDAIVFGSFGHMTRDKLNVEAIRAFHHVVDELPAGSVFLLVGKDWEQGEAQAEADRLGLGRRVRFLGFQDEATFLELVAACDVGISLRRPPTFGETSAALLDLLRHGVPTIVTDVGTFSDYPEDVVCKVAWNDDDHGVEALTRSMRFLGTSANGRNALGQSALRYVMRDHSWSTVATRYAEVIDNVARARRGVDRRWFTRNRA